MCLSRFYIIIYFPNSCVPPHDEVVAIYYENILNDLLYSIVLLYGTAVLYSATLTSYSIVLLYGTAVLCSATLTSYSIVLLYGTTRVLRCWKTVFQIQFNVKSRVIPPNISLILTNISLQVFYGRHYLNPLIPVIL